MQMSRLETWMTAAVLVVNLSVGYLLVSRSDYSVLRPEDAPTPTAPVAHSSSACPTTNVAEGIAATAPDRH